MTPRAWPVRRFAPIEGRRAFMAERANGARWHAGVDLASREGDPVLAPEDGTVVLVLPDADAVQGWRGYGPGVVVVQGKHSRAFHALTHIIPSANVGDVVQVGARVGSQSALRHVHYEIRARLQPTDGAAVIEDVCDPVAWMERDEVRRWDGSCPPRPEDSWRTPRACRPSWRGPRPVPAFPWPTPASPGAAPANAAPAASSSPQTRARRRSTSGGGGIGGIVVLALAALAVASVVRG